jgi:hypothetical protein
MRDILLESRIGSNATDALMRHGVVVPRSVLGVKHTKRPPRHTCIAGVQSTSSCTGMNYTDDQIRVFSILTSSFPPGMGRAVESMSRMNR